MRNIYRQQKSLTNYVLLRRQNDNRDTVFTVSLAFRDWIYTFDRWQKLRAQLEKAKMEGKFPGELRGRPPRPITILVDTDRQHISIDGEPESESRKADLPPDVYAQYIQSLYPNRKSVRRVTSRGNPLSSESPAHKSKSLGKGKLHQPDPKTEKLVHAKPLSRNLLDGKACGGRFEKSGGYATLYCGRRRRRCSTPW